MDKILINNQEINLLSADVLENGLELNFSELTLTEAEVLFPTIGTVSSFEVINEGGEVYGKYANLRAYGVMKNAIESEDGTIEEVVVIRLGALNETAERLNQVEGDSFATMDALESFLIDFIPEIMI